MTVVVILTTVKIRTLCDVAVGSKNQLHILNNALPTEREGGSENRKGDNVDKDIIFISSSTIASLDLNRVAFMK